MHSFTFNGHSSEEFGIRIERFPDLNRSERKFKSASVSGRNGNIYQMQDAWEEVTVSYQIFAGERQDGAAVSDFTAIMEWLNSADDYAILSDTYDTTHYRMAVFVDEMEIESQWHTFGKATVRFRCRPERFIVTEPIEVEDGDTITNPTNHIAKPIITLTGAGQNSLINLEKSVLDEDIWTWTITSDERTKMLNNLFWINDAGLRSGVYGHGVDIRSASGDYAGTISVKQNSNGRLQFNPEIGNYGVGMMVSVNADTDYVLSFACIPTTNREWSVYVSYVSDVGSVPTTKYKTYTDTQTVEFSFRTDTNTRYAIIAFIFSSLDTPNITSLMLAKGTTAQPFRAYVTEQVDTVTVGDTTMKITSQGFDEAEIDCERENLSMDGSDSNINATVLDQYGNASVDFLALKEGSNTVSYTSGITAVSVEPRFWEL